MDKIFNQILDAFDGSFIKINRKEIESGASFGYCADCDGDNLREDVKNEVLAVLLDLEAPDFVSVKVKSDDDSVTATIDTIIGRFIFEFFLYADAHYKFISIEDLKKEHITITVTSIEVVKFSNQKGAGSSGHDTVSLVTNLPCGTFPYEGFARLKIDIAKGQIDEYLAINFPGVEVKTINV